MVAVRVSHVTKSFDATQVLKGIDIHVPDGDFAVLVGPSGCGKSTLLRLLAGLEEVTSGTLTFGEREVTHLQPRDRDVAMVFQSYALYPHLSVRENLAFGLKLRKTDPATIKARVDEVAAMLGLGPLLGRLPKALSGGQRQRVAMGRAIVRRPALFLFDEPLSNLDAALRAQVRVDIRRLHDQLQATSVYVTHDQVEAMTLADIMFVLNSGVVEQSGKPLEVYDAPATRFVAGFLGSPAMNFIAGTIETAQGTGAARVKIGDGSETLAVRDVPVAAGRPVDVGVRPHDLELCSGAESDVTLRVDFVEFLGAEIHAHCLLAGTKVVACVETSAGAGIQAGSSLPLRVRKLHLFDRETGRAIR